MSPKERNSLVALLILISIPITAFIVLGGWEILVPALAGVASCAVVLYLFAVMTTGSWKLE